MHKKQGWLGLLFTIGCTAGAIVSTGTVDADATVYNASSVCVWDATDNQLEPSVQGWIQNFAASGAGYNVSCGLILTNDVAASTTDDVYVYVSDNNSGTDMEDNFICNVYTCGVTGESCANEQTLFCDGSGGTTSPNSNYTGEGYCFFTNLSKPAFGIPNVNCDIPADGGAGLPALEGIYMVH